MVPEIRVRVLGQRCEQGDQLAQGILKDLIALVDDRLKPLASGRYRAADVVWNAHSAPRADIDSELESESVARSKHILYCMFIHAAWDPGRCDPYRTVLIYPEGSFMWLPVTPSGSGILRFPEHTFVDRSEAAERITRFLLGDRAWFDLNGTRWAIRTGVSTGSEKVALIIEDETEYADLLGYVALRTGIFGSVDVVRSEGRFRQLRQAVENTKSVSAGVLLHSLDYAFPDHPEWEGFNDGALSWDVWRTLAQRTGLWRNAISGASADEMRLVSPSRWKVQHDPVAIDDESVRGAKKPLGWIHDLLSSGLLSFELPSGVKIGHDVFTSFGLEEGGALTQAGEPTSGHSATGWSQSAAQELLARSRKALAEGEAILSATMALEAVRLLKGRSVTLFLDAVTALYVAEAHAETRLACAAHGGRTPIRRRARELDQVAAWLSEHKLASDEMLRDQTTRIYLALRNVYQQAGAFDAADEVLLQVHRIGYDVRWVGSARRPNAQLNTSSGIDRLKKASVMLVHAARSRFLHLTDARSKLGSGLRWIVWLLIPIACVWLLLSGNSAFLQNVLNVGGIVISSIGIVLWGPDPFRWPHRKAPYATFLCAIALGLAGQANYTQFSGFTQALMFRSTDQGVAALGILALVWLLTKGPDGIGWLALALMPSRWVVAAAASIIVLSSANLTTFCRNSEGAASCQEGFLREVPLALTWTTGQMLGVNAPQKSSPTEDAKANGFQLNGAPSQHFLWFENTLTGWALFALGLSAIYRKATRG